MTKFSFKENFEEIKENLVGNTIQCSRSANGTVSNGQKPPDDSPDMTDPKYQCPSDLPLCEDYEYTKKWGTCTSTCSRNHDGTVSNGQSPPEGSDDLTKPEYQCPEELPVCENYVYNQNWGKCVEKKCNLNFALPTKNNNQKDPIDPNNDMSTILGLMRPDGSPSCLDNVGCLDPAAINYKCQGKNDCDVNKDKPGTGNPVINSNEMCNYPKPINNKDPLLVGDKFTIYGYSINKDASKGDHSFLATCTNDENCYKSGVHTLTTTDIPINKDNGQQGTDQLWWTFNRLQCPVQGQENRPEQAGRETVGSKLFIGDWVNIVPYYQLDGITKQPYLTDKSGKSDKFDRSLRINTQGGGNWQLTCKSGGGNGGNKDSCMTHSEFTWQIVEADGNAPSLDDWNKVQNKNEYMVYKDSILRLWNPHSNAYLKLNASGSANFAENRNCCDSFTDKKEFFGSSSSEEHVVHDPDSWWIWLLIFIFFVVLLLWYIWPRPE